MALAREKFITRKGLLQQLAVFDSTAELPFFLICVLEAISLCEGLLIHVPYKRRSEES